MPDPPDAPAHDPVPVRFPDGSERLVPWLVHQHLGLVAAGERLTVEAWVAKHLPRLLQAPSEPNDLDKQ